MTVVEGLVSPPPGSSVAARIRAALPSLVPSDAKVARFILDDPDVVYRSVSQVADQAGTSASTVVRCCKQLGYEGFQHLKIALARDLALANPQDRAHADDTRTGVLHRVMASSRDAIDQSLSTVDEGEFDRAVSALRIAGRVLCVGVGTSGPLAQDAAYRLLTIGVDANGPADIHVQCVAARLLRPGDVCVAVSHSGATRETLTAAEAAAEAGATTIAVTSFSRSALTRLVDIVLVAGGPEMSFRLEAMASRIAHLSVLDALYVALALESDHAQDRLDTTAQTLAKHRL